MPPVPIYPNEVLKTLSDLSHAGPMRGTVSFRSVNFDCACFVEFSLSAGTTVDELTFRSNGCGYMLAAAETLAAAVAGKELIELQGLQVAMTIEELGPPPNSRIHCFEAVETALRGAFAELRAGLVTEFTGEKVLICTCFGVSEETIESYVERNRPATVNEVAAAIRAGSGCGSCRMLIQEIIDINSR